MYTYTILGTHSHVAGGGQTEAHTVQKKNIDRAERAADIRLTNPKGRTPCDTLCGKGGGKITEARRRQRYEMPRKKISEQGVAFLLQKAEAARAFLLLGYYSARFTQSVHKYGYVHT